MAAAQQHSGYLLKMPVEKPGAGAHTGPGIGGGAGGGVGGGGGGAGGIDWGVLAKLDQWKRRWFVLRGRTLEYRTSKDSSSAKGELTLTEGALCSEVDNAKWVFEVWSLTGSVTLRAESAKEHQGWLRALRPLCKARTMVDQGMVDNTPSTESSSPKGDGGAGATTADGGVASKPLLE